MRNLMLATASAIVLGMAGTGIGHTAKLDSSPTTTPKSAMQTPSTMTASEILISAAQQQLKYSGLYNGSVNGKLGLETQQALRQFQQHHGLRQSGALDEKTYTALQGDAGDTGQVGVGSNLAPGGQPSAAAGSDYTSGSGRNSGRRHQ
jgi:peptidoglycan hydrolase-like protein with peptidoglycan-binding domain